MLYSYSESVLRKDIISCEDAKFGIVLALSFLEEDIASDAVLNFNPKNQCGGLSSYEQLADCALQYGVGMVRGLIKYFFQNPVLSIESRTSRVYQSSQMSALGDILLSNTEESLYYATMDLFIKYPPTKFIALYIKTKQFHSKFASSVRAKYAMSADHVRKNQITDGVIQEISDAFYKWAYSYCTDNRPYDPKTCTPIAFLLNAFKFFSSSPTIYTILNTRGQEFSVGENMTYLDTVDIVDTVDKSSLNFVSVCARIFAASKLLYSHANHDVLFYDLFSQYRDEKITDTLLGPAKRDFAKLSGLIFNLGKPSLSLDATALATKFAGRSAIGKCILPIVDVGISKKEIYPLYKQLLQVTTQQTVKDGARLFSTSDHTTKHSESNSQMLRILVDGACALRELVQYVNQHESTLGVTLNTFPIDIFRNATFLRRFKTLEDYVNYVTDVRTLVGDVQRTPSRVSTIEEATGLYSNDAVYLMMSQENLLGGSVFSELRNAPLSIFSRAVKMQNGKTKDQNLFENLLLLRRQELPYKISKDFSVDVLCRLSDNDVLRLIFKFTDQLYAALQSDGVQFNLPIANTTVKFCICLVEVLRREGHPLLSDDNVYCGGTGTVYDVLDLIYNSLGEYSEDSTMREFVALYQNNLKKRCVVIHDLHKLITGEDRTEHYDLNMLDLRNLCILATFLKAFINESCDCLSFVQGTANDLYVILAQLVEKEWLLRMPGVIASVDELSLLLSHVNPFRIKHDDDTLDYAALNDRRDKFILCGVNKFFSTIKLQHQVFTMLGAQINTCFSMADGRVNIHNSKLDRILLDVNMSILGSSDVYGMDVTIKHQLMALVDFEDETNVAVYNDRRIVHNNTYFHKEGIAITVSNNLEINDTCDLRVMTEDDINFIVRFMTYGEFSIE